jgi:hypothetical protein
VGQPVELGDHQHGVPRATGDERRDEPRPIGAFAALYLPELGDQLATCLCDVRRDGLALRLKPEAGPPLAVGRDAQIADEAGQGRGHGPEVRLGVSPWQTVV